jgi:hypothetical protein
MPFPAALAKRLSWVASVTLDEHTYSIIPPVPSKNVPLIGVNLHLVANENVAPKAIAELLKTLYGPQVENRFSQKLVEADLLISSDYPNSAGTMLYLESKKPIFTQDLSDKLKKIFELLLSLGSAVLLVWKWFKSDKDEEFEYELSAKKK